MDCSNGLASMGKDDNSDPVSIAILTCVVIGMMIFPLLDLSLVIAMILWGIFLALIIDREHKKRKA